MTKEFEIGICNMGGKDLEFISLCSTCKSIKETSEDKWFKIEDDPVAWEKLFSEFYDSPDKGISHGYCPPCGEEFRKGYGLKD